MEVVQQTHKQRTHNQQVALGLIGCSFVGVVAFTSPFIFMQLKSALPYMATPRSKVERALQFISKRTNSNTQQLIKKKGINRNFVDLGSGDGSTILTAASLQWKATGFELNPTLWFISSIRRLFSTSQIRNNSSIVLGDMFTNKIAKERLQQSNCVMIFGVKSLMPQIASLVQNQCQPGCYLLSYRFKVPLLSEKKTSGVNDEEKDNDNLLDASLIHDDEEEMRIYQLNENTKQRNN